MSSAPGDDEPAHAAAGAQVDDGRPQGRVASSAAADDDRTARARIRDAAFARFAADGVAATSLKSIADDVGVSPALVIHHFGSKQGLRAACDAHVVAQHRKLTRDTNVHATDPMQVLRELDEFMPIVAYLARTLADGSPQVTELISDLVDGAMANYPEALARGIIKPADRPRERAVILLTWQLGMLVLHEHLERLLGVDITDSSSDGWLELSLEMFDILADGVMQPEFSAQWRAATQAALRDRPNKET